MELKMKGQNKMPDKVKITNLEEVRPENSYYDYPSKDSVIKKNQREQAKMVSKNRKSSVSNKG